MITNYLGRVGPGVENGHASCSAQHYDLSPRIHGGTIRTFVVSLVGVAALAAGLVLLRQHRTEAPPRRGEVPAGETLPVEISLEKLRELGY